MPPTAIATLVIVVYNRRDRAWARWPLLRANRTTITLIGAALLLGIGALSLPQAYATIDLGTLLLLFSMMVTNGHLFLAGFFGLVTQWVVRRKPAGRARYWP